MGATDVLPLIPIVGVTLAECAELARTLARRIADELRIPTYCYEASALRPERRNLAARRATRVRGAARSSPHRHGSRFRGAVPSTRGVARTGYDRRCARFPDRRQFQPQYHLHAPRPTPSPSTCARRGRPVREGNPITGKIVKDAEGNLGDASRNAQATKAIGWYIEEYGIAWSR